MRLFAAIDIPEDAAGYMQKVQQRFRSDNIIATFPKHLHLTLLFLGDVDEPEVKKIINKLGKVKFPRTTLCLDRLGFFPNEEHIRVLWIGFKENNDVNKLAEDICDVLGRRQDKKFIPHVTLARIKNVKDKGILKKEINPEIEPKSFEVESFKLIKSTLHEDGPQYEAVAEYKAESL